MCGFYINKNCRHGRSGKECHYLHPKLCYSYLNKGNDGCNKENCEYFHPTFCKYQEKCKSKKCKFFHKKQPKKNTDDDDSKKKMDEDSSNSKINHHNLQSNSHRVSHLNSHQIPDQNFQKSPIPQDTSQIQILEVLKELTKMIMEDRNQRKRNCCSQS